MKTNFNYFFFTNNKMIDLVTKVGRFSFNNLSMWCLISKVQCHQHIGKTYFNSKVRPLTCKKKAPIQMYSVCFLRHAAVAER